MDNLSILIEGRVIAKKNSKRVICRGNRPIVLCSEAYENFKESALWQLKKYKEQIKPPYFIKYSFFIKGKMDGDLDNLMASVNDVLQEAGIIENDRLIYEVMAKKVMGGKDFKTQIEIFKIQNQAYEETTNKN